MEKYKKGKILENIIRMAGSSDVTCDLCNTTHFVSSGDYDEGELEKLRKQAKENPDKFIEDLYSDFIPNGYINGLRIVIGCKCRKIEKYSEFLWNHKELIIEYFKEIQKLESNNVKKFEKELEKL